MTAPKKGELREADRAFRSTALGVVALFGVAWFLFLLTSRYPGYLHHDTTEIFMWSRVGWEMGYAKHPPLLPWLVRAASHVLPMSATTLVLLSAINLTVGAYAVWRVARMVLGDRSALLALCLYGLSPYVTGLALKLNHNAILVSLWPLIAWSFLSSLRERSPLSGVLFGLAAAAGALAKYYSLLILVACFAASLVSSERKRYYRSPAPYVTVAVFCALVAPNLHWLATHDMQSMQHAFRATASAWRPAVHFALLAPLLAAPMLAGWVAYVHRAGGRRLSTSATAARPADAIGMPEIVTLTVVPYLLTLLLTIAFRLQGSTSWALPVFSLVPVILAALAPEPGEAMRTSLRRLAIVACGLIVLAGPVALLASFRAGTDGAIEPRAELARDGAALWRAAVGGEPHIVGGNIRWATTASLELPSHPIAWSSHNPSETPWATPESLSRLGALLLCRDADDGCKALLAGQRGRRDGGIAGCRLNRQRTLLGMIAPGYSAEVWIIAPVGRSLGARAHSACNSAGGAPLTLE